MKEKVRLDLDFEIDLETIKDKGITPEQILKGIVVDDSDLVDGILVLPRLYEFNLEEEFLIVPNTCRVVSSEYITETHCFERQQ